MAINNGVVGVEQDSLIFLILFLNNVLRLFGLKQGSLYSQLSIKQEVYENNVVLNTSWNILLRVKQITFVRQRGVDHIFKTTCR